MLFISSSYIIFVIFIFQSCILILQVIKIEFDELFNSLLIVLTINNNSDK